RGPIHAGLPTLEGDRDKNPLAAALDLSNLGCDHVFVGDAALSPEMITNFKNYQKEHALTLHVDTDLPVLFDHEWHNRSDVARDVVRLTEGRTRQLFSVEPQPGLRPRPRGTITCDNTRYLRYQGELQITKRVL
ncbi:DUF871 family protein, partial [Lactobacillus sp. XV13L]|nr:DUF871 family protein [Lactobacillus sp. XV13L]